MRPERRRTEIDGLRVERRAVGAGVEAPVLVGHAAVFDEWATLYRSRDATVREVVRRGAFTAAIAEGQDVRSLFNHDVNFILARTKSGTLTLAEDRRGLMTDSELLDSPTNRERIIGPVERGDVSGMSFAFLARNEGDQVVTRKDDGTIVVERSGERITWKHDAKRDHYTMDRELLSVDLFDVSPVVYPAYVGTDLALRSTPQFEPRALLEEARALFRADADPGRRRRRSLILMDLDLRLAEARSTS